MITCTYFGEFPITLNVRRKSDSVRCCVCWLYKCVHSNRFYRRLKMATKASCVRGNSSLCIAKVEASSCWSVFFLVFQKSTHKNVHMVQYYSRQTQSSSLSKAEPSWQLFFLDLFVFFPLFNTKFETERRNRFHESMRVLVHWRTGSGLLGLQYIIW